MTLLAAIRQDDTILVAADALHVSMFNDDAYGATTEKLYPLGKRIVWGWYGDGGQIGSDLFHFVSTTRFENWDDLVVQCRNKINELRADTVLGALFAGYFDDVPRVVHVGDDLRAIQRSDSWFCGMCRMAAAVGWQASTALDTTEDVVRRLDIVMGTAISVSNHFLGAPHIIWRITPTERTRIR